jgi:signal transduction histidine kinase
VSSDSKISGLNILLVDDDADCREFVAIALEQEGMQVIQAEDAEQAVSILSEQQFDAVTTDKNLPGMDGIGLIRHIRESYGDLPVILITGHGSIGSAVDAFKFGAQDYLLKPLEDGEDLVHALSRAIEHHRLSTQNKILQERLIRAQRMESVGLLAGGVAHDLNNILSPMLALPQIIINQIQKILGKGASETNADPDLTEVVEELRQMEDSGRRAASVIQDLLALSVTGNYERKADDMNKVVRNYMKSAELIDLRLAKPDLIIETRFSDDIGHVSLSEPHVMRAISNLVRNAFDAVDEKGDSASDNLLRLNTFGAELKEGLLGHQVVEPGSYAVLSVGDTGVGIHEENIDKIFEPFFTTKDMSSTTGSGLGLSIVHGVIKDHSGFIDVKSELGKGTTFYLYFPVVEP